MSDPALKSGRVGVLRSELLVRIGVPHGFSTRVGGVSEGHGGMYRSLNFGSPSDLPPGLARESAANIAANFERLQRAIGAHGRRIEQVFQVHGDVCHVVTARQDGDDARPDPKADAMVTADPGCVLAVRTADCVPVLLATEDGKVVAAVHAGWRGVVSAVVVKALRELCGLAERSGGHHVGTGLVAAAIGPCIGPENFQVGPEVAEAFGRAFGSDAAAFVHPDPAQGGKFLVDLQSAIRHQLQTAGVGEVDTIELCTFERADLFFSHRRDRGLTGRMAAVVGPVAG